MEKPRPEAYFTGTQLDLARAIAVADLGQVQALVPTTDLNTPGAQDMTLLCSPSCGPWSRIPRTLGW